MQWADAATGRKDDPAQVAVRNADWGASMAMLDGRQRYIVRATAEGESYSGQAALVLPDHSMRIHRSSRPATDRRLRRLFEQLNEAEMTYPGTDLWLVYELAGAPVAQTENSIILSSAR